MRKILIIAIILISLASFTSAAYCDDAIKKLGRGICNVGTCVFELWEQPSRVSATDGPMAAWTYGILKGASMAVIRGLVGVYEIVSFPVPLPSNYKPILTDPEFFLEEQSW